MNSKSTTRLRLEFLEKRNLLSVTGWPLMPHTAGPLASMAGEYSQSRMPSAAHEAMQVAAQAVTQIPGLTSDSGPNLTSIQTSTDPDRSSFGQVLSGGRAGDSVFNVPGKPDFVPTLTPIEVLPDINSSHDQPVVVGRLGDRAVNGIGSFATDLSPIPIQVPPEFAASSMERPLGSGGLGDSQPGHDAYSSVELALASVPDSSTGQTSQPVNLDPIVPEQGCAVASSIRIATQSPPALQTSPSEDQPSLDGGLITLDPDVPRHERQSLGVVEDVILTIDLVVLYSPDVQTDPSGTTGPGSVPAASLGPMAGGVPPTDGGFDLASAGPATIGSAVPPVTPSRAVSPFISYTQETDAQPAAVDYSVLPVAKQHSTDSLAASDPLRLADLAITSDAGTLASGDTVSLANLTAFSSPSASRFTESGFITLGDSQSNTSPQGNLAIDPASGVQSAGLNPEWSIDPLANLRKSTDPAGAGRAASASGIFAVDVSSRSVSEGRLPGEGGIELAIADLSLMVSDNSGADILVGSIQPISNIPLESDAGLFCDMEVAVAGAGPAADSASTVHRRNLDPVDAGEDVMGWKSRAVKDFEPPLTNWSQPALAGLAGRLPLILGVTILVSRGGLRLEEKVPQRERKIRDFRQS